MKILAIEPSCDETAISFLEAEGSVKDMPRFKVLAHLVSSQIEIHRPFGGVVPNLAKREHIRNLPLLFAELVTLANSSNSKFKIQNLKLDGEKSDAERLMLGVDLIAVTVGPGLEPALWTGINFAQELAKEYNKPLIGANHLEGHLFSFLLQEKTENSKVKSKKLKVNFPAIGLIVSGGHTILVVLEKLNKWKKIGETKDDAVGEAFDKVARILDLPYPGGPEIEKLAKKGDPNAINFPRPMIHHKNYDFSFSGLKTSVLYYVRDHVKPLRGNVAGHFPRKSASDPRWSAARRDIAASFQKAAIDVLVKKTFRAAEEYGARSVILAGGVAANTALRTALKKSTDEAGIKFFCPEFEFNTDNASMIGAASYIQYLGLKKKAGKILGYPIEANGSLNL